MKTSSLCSGNKEGLSTSLSLLSQELTKKDGKDIKKGKKSGGREAENIEIKPNV